MAYAEQPRVARGLAERAHGLAQHSLVCQCAHGFIVSLMSCWSWLLAHWLERGLVMRTCAGDGLVG
eukprot:15469859-Alexandrium_andersonii.AAC.1